MIDSNNEELSFEDEFMANLEKPYPRTDGLIIHMFRGDIHEPYPRREDHLLCWSQKGGNIPAGTDVNATLLYDDVTCRECRQLLGMKNGVKYIDTMTWFGPWPWSRRCKARKARDETSGYYGRCELAPHGPQVDHCLERGMIWVRWKDGEVTYTEPDYKIVTQAEEGFNMGTLE